MSKSHIAASNRYNLKSYDRLQTYIAKGQKDILKSHADSMGESLNAFVNRAIAETVERDKAGQ